MIYSPTFTTIEQSKRLLQSGLPESSADMRYRLINNRHGRPYVVKNPRVNKRLLAAEKIAPCWSVGRLIEIELTCVVAPKGKFPQVSFTKDSDTATKEGDIATNDLVEEMVQYFESGKFKYDFSKLTKET